MSKQKQSPDEDGTMSDRMRESDLEMLRWFNENYGYDANAALDDLAEAQRRLVGNPVAPRTDIEYRNYIPSRKGCCGQNIAVGIIALVAVLGCFARFVRTIRS